MKNLILLFAALLTLSYAKAQDIDTAPKKLELSPHHVGLHIGAVTGSGFSYRYWPAKLGFQITGIPIINTDYRFTSLGVSALYLLKDNRKVDLFAYLGNHAVFTATKIFSNDSTIYNKFFFDNLGIGLGVKTTIWEVINLNFQVGYGFYNVGEYTSTNFTGEFGVYYQL